MVLLKPSVTLEFSSFSVELDAMIPQKLLDLFVVELSVIVRSQLLGRVHFEAFVRLSHWLLYCA